MVGELPKKTIEKRISNIEGSMKELTGSVKKLAEDMKGLQPLVGIVDFTATLAKFPGKVLVKNVEAVEETVKELRSKAVG